ncbi:MAG: MaoC family dehydratase [Gammaproteobacteria bacterium]
MAVSLSPETAPGLLGQELGVSDWFTIDQSRINAFADATIDHQFIHVDPERAKHTPFGTTIAHGFLTLSLLPYLVTGLGVGMEGAVMGLNYGFDKIRFLAPVKVGSRVRARARLADFQQKSPGQYLISQEISIEIENEARPALVATWLTMVMTG